jgi:hypothetical protein
VRIWWASAASVGLFFCLAASSAGSQEPSSVKAIDASGNTVELPAPPEELAALIKRGKVSFEFYDPEVTVRSFKGETRFEYRYSFQSRSDWKRTMQDGKPAIEIKIDYREIDLEMDHRVSLPQDMIGDDLFERALTLHEFDHVRISSDPRLPALLKSMLRERNSRVVRVLDEELHGFRGRPSNQDMARISKQLVQESSDSVFDDFVSVVSIRYRELDRLSNYGRKVLTQEQRQEVIESPPKVVVEED